VRASQVVSIGTDRKPAAKAVKRIDKPISLDACFVEALRRETSMFADQFQAFKKKRAVADNDSEKQRIQLEMVRASGTPAPAPHRPDLGLSTGRLWPAPGTMRLSAVVTPRGMNGCGIERTPSTPSKR
jgi:hypothetical protein